MHNITLEDMLTANVAKRDIDWETKEALIEEVPAEKDELIWDYDPIDAQLPDPRYQVWATDEQLNVPVEATVNEFGDTARGTEARIKGLLAVGNMYLLEKEKYMFMGTYHADKVEFRCEGDRVLVELYWF